MKRFILCALLLTITVLIAPSTILAQIGEDGQLFLPLMLRGPVEGQSSIQLIEQALQAGTISEEEALIYKVQVVVGDPELPPQYRGEDTHQDGTLVMEAAAEAFPTLSPATRAILEPYLRAPSDPTSWIALHEPVPTRSGAAPAKATALTWQTLSAVGGRVKIWFHPEYAGDGARAQKVAAELQRHVWPTLTGTFQAPKADCGAGCAEGGGDTRVDIYLAHIGRSHVRRIEIDPAGSAAYMVLSPTASYGVLAHEFMHMIQFSYPLVSFPEYSWIFESTAQWAMDFVYPIDNGDPDFPIRHEEQLKAPELLGAPHLSLEHINDGHEYGSYLYWFFNRTPEKVLAVLQNMSEPDSLQNANAAIEGGFQRAWPFFALYNWNQTPIEFYQQWDDLNVSALSKATTSAGVGEDTFPISVNHLAASYYHYDFIDDSIRRIRVELPLALQGVETAHVWAILKINGQWGAAEDWTTISEKVFCRDTPGENVEELVLIISNSNWQERTHVLAPGDGKVSTARSCGCQEANVFQEWTGTAAMSYNKTASDPDTAAEANRQAQLPFRLTREPDTAFGNYRWEGDPIAGSTASINDQVSGSGGNTFTWIGNKILPDTNRIRLEINPLDCTYEIWVGVFVDAIYNYGTGEQQEVMSMEYRVYDILIPEEATDWVLTGSRSLPAQVGGGEEGVDRFFTFSGAMGQLDLLLDGELGTAPVSWSFTPVEPQ